MELLDAVIKLRNDLAMISGNFVGLTDVLPCKELQNVAMDLESADQHLAGLIENGPTPPYAEVEYVQADEELPWS